MRVMAFGAVCISDILMCFILKHKTGAMAIQTQLPAFSFKQFFIVGRMMRMTGAAISSGYRTVYKFVGFAEIFVALITQFGLCFYKFPHLALVMTGIALLFLKGCMIKGYRLFRPCRLNGRIRFVFGIGTIPGRFVFRVGNSIKKKSQGIVSGHRGTAQKTKDQGNRNGEQE